MGMGKTFGRSSAGAAVLAAAFAFFACAPEAVFQGTVGVDCSPPSFVSARCSAADRLDLVFSEAVTVSSLRIDPPVANAAVSDGAAEVAVSFPGPLAAGAPYVVDLVAEDADGNTLSVLAPFRGRNDSPPRLLINEVRTEYSKPKAEFIELVVLGGGQLGGLAVVSSILGPGTPLFVFPPALVEEGELVVLHLRTLEEGCVDETGDSASSAGTEALPTARDFWVSGAEKRIRKTDGIAVLDCDGAPLDCVLLSENAEGAWKNDEVGAFAAFLAERGAWLGASGALVPADAAPSAALTATRTLCRNAASDDSNAAGDWKTVATGKATPGGINSEVGYAAKRK